MADGSPRIVEARFPPKLECLFRPARYKVLHGGRGGAKSWGIARALLIQGAQRKLRIPCLREFQKSIADSVHALLKGQIEALGLGAFYKVTDTYIEGANGTQFTFHGLHHNVQNIKSLEGADIAWVEEAQTVTKTSWDTLIPTIRKEGSEIWASFNPELEGDETYKRFVLNPPAGAVVVEINWRDNPWFPEVLRLEMEDLKARDYDAYLNVWEGKCRRMLEGAVYAKELRALEESGRITHVPYDPSKPVHTFWDLGWSDCTSIVMAQHVGAELRVIDFEQGRLRTLQSYVTALQGRGYVWGTDWMPHDAQTHQLAAGGQSIEDQMRKLGRTVRITPRVSLIAGMNAARALFPKVLIDAAKCSDLLQALRHYRYEVDPDTREWSDKPLHDENSHAADAWRYLAVAWKEPTPQAQVIYDDYEGRL